MDWLNIYGLIFVLVLLAPNAVYAIKCPTGFENRWVNRRVEMLEQVGRFGCFGFMIFNVPGTWFGFWSSEAFVVYLVADIVLLAVYCLIWAVCFWKQNVPRALALSVLPSAIFLFSGIMSRSVLLILAALLFAPCHVLISYKNAKALKEQDDENT